MHIQPSAHHQGAATCHRVGKRWEQKRTKLRHLSAAERTRVDLCEGNPFSKDCRSPGVDSPPLMGLPSTRRPT